MAPRKCTRARQAGEGAGRGGHSPAWPRPGGPGDALGPRGRGRAGFGEGGSGPPAALLPPPPLPRGAPGGRPRGGTRVRAGLGAAPQGGPGSGGPPPGPRRRPAPFPAPRLQLPPGPLRRPLLPSQARGVRRGPATGGTCAPQIWIRETLARAWPEGRRMAVGARGGSPMCWNSQRLCSLREAKHFLHIKKKKNVPSCCLDLAGAIFKALPLGGSSGPRGTEALCCWVLPLTPPQSRGPGLARRPEAARLVSGHQTWDPGREPAASTSHARGPRRWSAVCWRDSAMRAGRALFPATQKPTDSHLSPPRSAARPPRVPGVG